jgi:flap endonuclease-1
MYLSLFLQFIDLCILLGCDYLEPIKGVGPKSALKLIREYGGLDKVIKHLREKSAATKATDMDDDDDGSDKEKSKAKDDDEDNSDAEKTEEKKKPKKKRKGGVVVPEDWPWEEAKKVFEKPDVKPADEVEVEWKNPDVEGLVEFLVKEKGFKCAILPFFSSLYSLTRSK